MVVVKRPETSAAIKSQFSVIVRAMYSNPPNHGARVVACILNDADLYRQWLVIYLVVYSKKKKLSRDNIWKYKFLILLLRKVVCLFEIKDSVFY